MTEARSIPAGASGVIAGNAWISGDHARLVLDYLIGPGRDWRGRLLDWHISAEDFKAVAEAVSALQAAAMSARRLSDVEATQPEPSFDAWLTPKQLADAVGVSQDHIGRLRRCGRLEGAEVAGRRWKYPPAAVEHLQRSRRSP